MRNGYIIYNEIENCIIKDLSNQFKVPHGYFKKGDIIYCLSTSESKGCDWYIRIGCIPWCEEEMKKYLYDVYGIRFVDRCSINLTANDKYVGYYPYYMRFDCGGICMDIVSLLSIRGLWNSVFNKYL